MRKYLKYILAYISNIHDLKGHFAIILSACEINDPQEDEKIRKIAREYDRLYMLLRLNGVYDSNAFQEISYNLNGRTCAVGVVYATAENGSGSLHRRAY